MLDVKDELRRLRESAKAKTQPDKRPIERYEGKIYEDPNSLTFYDYSIESLDKALVEMAEGRKLAAVFKRVVPESLRKAVVQNLENHQAKEHYEGAELVGRIGMSLYETQFNPDLLIKYFETAASNREMARAVFRPFGSPVDTLRAMCDELPSFCGANLLRLRYGTAFVGLIRYLDEGGEILPHTDNPAWDVPESLKCQQIETSIAWNLHLQAASEGGEVTVYGRRPTKLEYDAYRREAPNSYALKDEFLPRRSVTIRPEAGDIVLFNASLPHRVNKTSGETRFTKTCFIGIDRERHLHLFS